MAKHRKGKRLTFKHSISDERMTEQEQQEAEQIMAKLVARAWAADHPELFGPKAVRGAGSQAKR